MVIFSKLCRVVILKYGPEVDMYLTTQLFWRLTAIVFYGAEVQYYSVELLKVKLNDYLKLHRQYFYIFVSFVFHFEEITKNNNKVVIWKMIKELSNKQSCRNINIIQPDIHCVTWKQSSTQF